MTVSFDPFEIPTPRLTVEEAAEIVRRELWQAAPPARVPVMARTPYGEHEDTEARYEGHELYEYR